MSDVYGAESSGVQSAGWSAYRFFRLLCLALACQSGQTLAQTPDFSAERLAFKAAEQALLNGAPAQLEALKQYPLYPYLLYQDLTRRLAQNPAEEISRFLTAFSDSPLAEQLRTLWLGQLAKEQRWEEFLRFYQPGGSVELECWQRQALLHTGRREPALHAIETVWMNGSALADACKPLFALWKDQGGLTPERIWQRFKRAIEQKQMSLARFLQNQMPGADQAAAQLWFKVDSDPRLILEAGLWDETQPRHIDILLYGLERWSNADSVSAANALDILKTRFSLPEERLIPLERKIAVFMATRGHPDALSRLSALPQAAVDNPVREWRVRCALRSGDWNALLLWLDRLTPEENASPRWQYWRARALEALGRSAEAERLYQSVAGLRDYHGFLAADRLKVGYSIKHRPLQVSAEELAVIENIPGLQRARELYYLERLAQARAEWQFATQTFDKEQLKKAARLAYQWNWHAQAIATLAQAGYWDDLEMRFPLPFQETVLARARHQNLDPAWVYAVMRQESAFRADAISTAGALGLMQVMPATGQRMAWELQLSAPNQDDLLQIDTNIRYGTLYLRKTLDSFQNHPVLATAAYNAGPERVMQWLPAQEAMEADRWAEIIPFAETRQYVQRVLEYTAVYAERLGAGRSLKDWMKPIPVAGAATALRPPHRPPPAARSATAPGRCSRCAPGARSPAGYAG